MTLQWSPELYWLTTSTEEAYRKCIESRHLYCGITPRFIHWFLQSRDVNTVRKELENLEKTFYSRKSGMQNSNRISYNVALNHMCWCLWCHFLTDCGICSITERNEDIAEHYQYMLDLQDKMLNRCTEEQNGLVFLYVLEQLIISNSVAVEGLNLDDDTKHRPMIGFLGTSNDGRKVANIFPHIAFKCVMDASRDSKIKGNIRELGRQFVDMGYSLDAEGDRYQKQVRFKGPQHRVWAIDLSKLGLADGPNLGVVQGEKVVNATGLPPFHKAVPTEEYPF
jgi:hypothetical protein